MKKLILTSNTKHYHKENDVKIANSLFNENKIVECLNEIIDKQDTLLFVASSPESIENNKSYAQLLFEGLKLSGISFRDLLILDDRTKDKAQEFIKRADAIFLSGGDTYIQNKFFELIRLKELLQDYDGVIIGQSAGSMNLAENVFNSPENGIDSKPMYYSGLGLIEINVIPHFVYEEELLDEFQLYERKYLIEESYNRKLYGLCDGSHIVITERICVYGKTYLIQNGKIELLCDNQEYLVFD